MCDYCNYYKSTKGGKCGKDIKITIHRGWDMDSKINLQVFELPNDTPCMQLFVNNLAVGHADINYCPICGRKLGE